MIDRINFLHTQGYLHNDIRPMNFRIDNAGGKQTQKIYITNFSAIMKIERAHDTSHAS